jgi:hypothetical protein
LEDTLKRKIALIFGFCLIFCLNILSAQTWSATKRLTWTAGYSRNPDIAIDSSNNIFVVYYDDSSGVMHTYFKKSLDGGLSWTGKQMTFGSYPQYSVKLGVDSGDTLHMIYQGKYYEIMHRRTTNAGNTWSSVNKVTWNTSSTSPDIAIDSGNKLYVAWSASKSGNTEIYFKKSTDSGTTWIGLKRLTWNAGQSTRPSIAVDSTGNIHVIWQDDTPGQWQIFYKKSTDSGSSWSSYRRMTWAISQALRPAIAKDSSDNLYLIYDTSSYIYYKKSTNKGSSWTGSKRITWTKNSLSSNICIDSTDTIHICWSEYFSPIGRDICYKQSTNGGSTWISTKRVTYGLKTGTDLPAISFDSNNDIHFVWDANKSGNYEIYYKNRK